MSKTKLNVNQISDTLKVLLNGYAERLDLLEDRVNELLQMILDQKKK